MKQTSLVKNYIFNITYQMLVLLAPLITTPYVSRVLGVTNVGIFQYTETITAYFVLFGCVGTSLYGQREIAYHMDDPVRRTRVFWETELFRLSSNLIWGILFIFICCRQGEYAGIYIAQAVIIVSTALDVSWFFMGVGNFRITMVRMVIIKSLEILAVFLFVRTKEDLIIYVLCSTVPTLIGNLSLWCSLKNYLVRYRPNSSDVLHGMAERIKPVLMLFLPQVATDVYIRLDVAMLGWIGTDIDQVGLYSQAQKVVRIVLLIVTSLGSVMLTAMSSSFAKGEKEKIVQSLQVAFRFIYMLSFALAFGLCAIAPRFVPVFFGAGYEPVIMLIAVISPILVIVATSNVLGKQYLLPTDQQKAYTASVLLGTGVNAFLNLLLIPVWNAIGASVATVIAELAVAAAEYCYVRKQLPVKSWFLHSLRYGVMGLVMFFVVRGAGMLLPPGKIWVIPVMVAVGVIVYVSELCLIRDPIFRTGISLLKKKQN